MGFWDRANSWVDSAGQAADELRSFRDELQTGTQPADTGVQQPAASPLGFSGGLSVGGFTISPEVTKAAIAVAAVGVVVLMLRS